MNNEKEIKRILEIANEATANCKVCTDCKFRINGDCCNRKVGEAIADAGYGNVKQAVKEFAEKLKSHKHLMGSIDGNSAYVWFENELDNLIAELYGADE